MPTRAPVTTLDTRRYAQTFAVFVERSHEYPAVMDRLAGAADQLPDGFACLDIGAGTGTVVRDWLARGGRRPGRYVAIEPNPAHVDQLHRNLAALGLDADVYEEGFYAEYAIPGRFDLA